MKAVIMAGGLGTRLRPMTETVPKPCVSVVGVPCIVRILRNLSALGIREFHVSLLYLPQQIRRVFASDEFKDLNVHFHEETMPLGTSGSVRNCLRECDDDFIVVSGDIVFDFDLSKALDFHCSHGGPLTLISTRVSDSGEYGVLLSEECGRISRFLEKPDWSHLCSDDVNTGIYICSPEILNYIPDGSSDFPKEVFSLLTKAKIPIYHYSATGFWRDVGTVRSYLDCNRAILEKQGNTLQSPEGDGTVIESPCFIGKNVRLSHCHIGPYTVIGDDCVLTKTRLEGCVLESAVRCESGTVARNAILCKNSVLHHGVRVGDGCVVGSDCEIGAECTLSAGVKIYPSNRIPQNTFLSDNVHRTLRSLQPTEGKILFPFGEDFGGAMIYEVGRAFSELFGGEVVVGRAEQRDASATMTFCGGVLSCGNNVYDTGVNDLSQFRFTVRNYAFRCGAFFQRNYSNLILRLFDGNGMPLSPRLGQELLQGLSRESCCGEKDGIYRIFRGGAKSYQTFLRSFGIPNRLSVRVMASPVLSSLLPRNSDVDSDERMRLCDEWIRMERLDGEPYDEDLIRLCCCIALGRKKSVVYIPDSFPNVTEAVAKQCNFRVVRVCEDDETVRRLLPLTDPNVQALLILNLLQDEKCTFQQLVSRFPSFSVKQRDVSVHLPPSSVMRMLVSSGGELSEGVRFFDPLGVVRIVPKANGNTFRILSEASNAESAEELCDFYSLKLKGLKPD